MCKNEDFREDLACPDTNCTRLCECFDSPGAKTDSGLSTGCGFNSPLAFFLLNRKTRLRNSRCSLSIKVYQGHSASKELHWPTLQAYRLALGCDVDVNVACAGSSSSGLSAGASQLGQPPSDGLRSWPRDDQVGHRNGAYTVSRPCQGYARPVAVLQSSFRGRDGVPTPGLSANLA